MDRTKNRWAFTFAMIVLAAAAPLRAATESTGVSSHGAAWRIAVPDGWRAGDGLVLVQHGFQFGHDLDPDLGPLRARMLADGYAIAASGYRHHGWATFRALDDNADLLEIFTQRHGAPGRLVAAGGSMGGLIALRLAEDARFRDRTAGVLALCPVSNGLALWEHAFDLRLAYDALCADVDGGKLPRGAEPTPWAVDPEYLVAALALPDDERALLPVAAPVAACTGLGLPSALRSDSMRRRLAALAEVAGTTNEDALAQQLAYSVFGLSDLVRDPGKLDGRIPFDNIGARYGSIARPPNTALQAVDARIARVDADDLARLRFEDRDRLDGSATARIMSLHTSRDPIVPPGQQFEVLARYATASRPALVALAAETAPTHCGFSDAELDAGWRTLRDWIAAPASATPSAAQLQARCVVLGPGACRWRDPDPRELAATLPSVPLRADPPFPQPISGLWYDPTRDGQGLMVEELEQPIGATPNGEHRVAVSWYTWAPGTQSLSGPRWMIGVGRLRDAGFVVDTMQIATAGAFGTRLQPGQMTLAPWGRIEFAVDRDSATLHFDGPSGWGSGTRTQSRLTESGWSVPYGIEFSPPPPAVFNRIGTYYSTAHPGQGWVLNQYPGAGGVESALLWYTFDSSGRPVWMVGIDANANDGLAFRMIWSSGGGSFDSALAAPLPAWGDVTLESNACDVTAVNWRADTHGFGDGRIVLTRLTDPYEYTRYDACVP